MSDQIPLEKTWSWVAPALAKELVFRDAAQGHEVRGRAAARQAVVDNFLKGFRNIQVQVRSIQVQSHYLTLQLLFQGRHHGTFAGIPPTRRAIAIALAVRCELRGGRIRQILLDYDAGELLEQLGLIRLEKEKEKQK